MVRFGFPHDSIDAALRWAAEWDDVSKTRGLARRVASVPGAEVVVLDSVSHNFVIESPDVVAQVIVRYLDHLPR
jgi:pimeloyl-ACP methyl ester carboxylesterase